MSFPSATPPPRPVFTVPAGGDVKAAIEQARPVGGIVQLVDGTYGVNGSLAWVPSGVAVRGMGPGRTVVRNEFAGDGPFPVHAVFGAGSVARQDLPRLAMIRPSQAPTPRWGDVFLLVSTEWLGSANPAPIPASLRLVSYGPAAANRIIDHWPALKWNLSRGTYDKTGKIGGLGPLHATRDVEISNMTLVSARGNALEVNGCLRGRFRSLELLGDALRVNTCQECVFRNITGTFGHWALECGLQCAATLFSQIRLRFTDRGLPQGTANLVQVGEDSRDVTLAGIDIDGGPVVGGGAYDSLLRIDGGNNLVLASKFCGTAISYAVAMGARSYNNVVDRCSFVERRECLRDFRFGDQTSGNKLYDCTFLGNPREASSAGIYNRAEGLTFQGGGPARKTLAA